MACKLVRAARRAWAGGGCLRENCISMNLPKRDELLLRSVRALPNASSSGLDDSTWAATLFCPPPALLTTARYCIMIFTDSVFPAPDSPETRMDWLAPSWRMC